MRTVIVLNGPPNSGKDAIADAFAERYNGVVRTEFKEGLYAMTAGLFQIPVWRLKELCRRDTKEQRTDELLGFSPREALIHTSENVIKPLHGKPFFGSWLLRKLRGTPDPCTVIVSDGGFDDEIDILRAAPDVKLILVRLERDGCTFEGDSRSYVKNPELTLVNDCSIICAAEKVAKYVHSC